MANSNPDFRDGNWRPVIPGIPGIGNSRSWLVNDDRGPGWVVEEGGEVRGAVVAGVGGCRSRGGGGEDW